MPTDREDSADGDGLEQTGFRSGRVRIVGARAGRPIRPRRAPRTTTGTTSRTGSCRQGEAEPDRRAAAFAAPALDGAADRRGAGHLGAATSTTSTTTTTPGPPSRRPTGRRGTPTGRPSRTTTSRPCWPRPRRASGRLDDSGAVRPPALGLRPPGRGLGVGRRVVDALGGRRRLARRAGRLVAGHPGPRGSTPLTEVLPAVGPSTPGSSSEELDPTGEVERSAPRLSVPAIDEADLLTEPRPLFGARRRTSTLRAPIAVGAADPATARGRTAGGRTAGWPAPDHLLAAGALHARRAAAGDRPARGRLRWRWGQPPQRPRGHRHGPRARGPRARRVQGRVRRPRSVSSRSS